MPPNEKASLQPKHIKEHPASVSFPVACSFSCLCRWAETLRFMRGNRFLAERSFRCRLGLVALLATIRCRWRSSRDSRPLILLVRGVRCLAGRPPFWSILTCFSPLRHCRLSSLIVSRANVTRMSMKRVDEEGQRASRMSMKRDEERRWPGWTGYGGRWQRGRV